MCGVQGLGLLINLVEYSARNKYCLMEMEMEGGQGPCDSTVLLNPPHQDIIRTGPLSAIAALVLVRSSLMRVCVYGCSVFSDCMRKQLSIAPD